MATRRLTPVRAAAGALGLWATLALAPAPAGAQTDARLASAVQLAQNGMADSARALVQRVMVATQPSDSLYPEVLYTSGIVAATEYDRRIALRRVIVEYSTSPWADDALLLLGQVDYANANPAAALAQFARLVGDYPTSPLIAVAAFWGARAASDIQNGAEACRLADIGLAARTEDVELKNQLDYQRQRCTAIASVQRDTARPAPAMGTPPKPTPAAAEPPRAAAPTKGIWVQIIAAPNQAKADETVAAAKRAGYPAVVVSEGGYFKVRAGPFPTRNDGNAALAKIRARMGGKPFLVVVP